VARKSRLRRRPLASASAAKAATLRHHLGWVAPLALVLLALFTLVLFVSIYLLETTANAGVSTAEGSNVVSPRRAFWQQHLRRPAPSDTAVVPTDHAMHRPSGATIGTRISTKPEDWIDMRQLVRTLSFDNPDGGVWKQGWNVTARDDFTNAQPLQVFVVPHSHCDPGWIKTFDDYFQSQTRQILTTVVQALQRDQRRKFIWAEISYFEWWYREQKDDIRKVVQTLLDNKQLQFVTGGWVQPDEANSELYAMEIQLQEGHDWIRQTFGDAHVPKHGWSIDPFGYSPTMAYLLQKYGFKAMLIQRVHYAVKKELAQRRHLEFYWRQTWEDATTAGTHDIFTHVMPFFSYDVPHTCGPDPSVCCQFDFQRTTCPWLKAPQTITSKNVAERAMLLLDQYRKKAALYRSNVVLAPLGDDFRYLTAQEAEAQYTNYQAIFDYVNANLPNVKMQFGTLSDYFDAVVGSFDTPILQGSFFTYSDIDQDYWSGYFTSRVSDKALGRWLERVLYSATQMGASKQDLQAPRRALSLFQHHDGVTGTAKTHVHEDYARQMMDAIHTTEDWMLRAIHQQYGTELQPLLTADTTAGAIQPCWVAPEPRTMPENACESEYTVDSAASSPPALVAVYNPLSTSQHCGNVVVPGQKLRTATLPCELPGPTSVSQTKFVFHPETGLMLEPVKEEWKVWKVKKGGAYLFFPGQLRSYELTKHDVIIEDGGYVVSTESWKRTVVEREIPTDFGISSTVIDFVYETTLIEGNREWFVRFSGNVANNGIFHTDLNGFNFDTHYFRADMPIQSQVFPMPTMSAIQDDQTRLTVLSEHAQGAASLQDGAIDVWLDRRLDQDDDRGLGQGISDNRPTRTRLRVVVERETFNVQKEFDVTPLVRRTWDELQHPLVLFGKHVKKSIDLVADPWKHRSDSEARQARRERQRQQRARERQRQLQEKEEKRGAGDQQLFVNDKPKESALKGFWNTGIITSDFFGFFRKASETLPKDQGHEDGKQLQKMPGKTRVSKGNRRHRHPPVDSFQRKFLVNDADWMNGGRSYASRKTREIKNRRFTMKNTDIPFVLMVYKRVDYLKKAIDSVRRSDFPKSRVPLIISHDGRVPEVVEYVESLKDEFKIIQLIHPHSCYEHPNEFPGDDPTLNEGFAGDSYGNPRSAWITCCKHHFTWMLHTVFRRDFTDPAVDTFLFLEEDYIVAPTIYSAVIAGLNVMEDMDKEISGGFFGLGMDPSMANTAFEPYYKKATWYVEAFKSGPMTMNRDMFKKLQQHAKEYCTFDDYNWDWSIVHLQRKKLLPRALLMPSKVLAKHIGVKEGMHTNKSFGKDFSDLFPNYAPRREQLTTHFAEYRFTGNTAAALHTEFNPGYGGWGHPKDHEHCMKVLQS
jgi:hypothetical protein